MSPENQQRLQLLRSAPLNKWVALSADESQVIAIGETYGEACELSDRAGVTDPVILKTPESWTALSV